MIIVVQLLEGVDLARVDGVAELHAVGLLTQQKQVVKKMSFRRVPFGAETSGTKRADHRGFERQVDPFDDGAGP